MAAMSHVDYGSAWIVSSVEYNWNNTVGTTICTAKQINNVKIHQVYVYVCMHGLLCYYSVLM